MNAFWFSLVTSGFDQLAIVLRPHLSIRLIIIDLDLAGYSLPYLRKRFQVPNDAELGLSGFDPIPAGGNSCLLYTSDAADEEDSVDLGGRRIIKKKNTKGVWNTF